MKTMTKEDLKELRNITQKIMEQLHAIDKTLVKQEEHLKVHIYRTEICETRLEKIEDSLVPIQKHVSKLEGALKFIGVLAIVTSIMAGLIKVFTSF